MLVLVPFSVAAWLEKSYERAGVGDPVKILKLDGWEGAQGPSGVC